MALFLGGLGLAATVGQWFLTKAFAFGSPAKVSVVGLVQVVMGMALDVFLFDRTFSPPTLLGIALILAPTAWLMAPACRVRSVRSLASGGREPPE